MEQHDVEWLFEVLDVDGSGSVTIDEFIDGCLNCKASEQSRQLLQLQCVLRKEIHQLRVGTICERCGNVGGLGSSSNMGDTAAAPDTGLTEFSQVPSITSEGVQSVSSLDFGPPHSPQTPS